MTTPILSRRRLLQTSAAVAGATALTAAPALTRSTRAQDKATVRALMWSNSPTMDDNFKKRAQAFNDAHADTIEIDLQFLPYDQYWQKLQLSYSANDPYDVYFWDVQAYGHYKKDLLLNLQPMIDAAGLYDPAQYPVDLFTPWKLDGTNFFAVPENLQSMMLYYNKSLFDAAGIPIPDDNWTWDQALEAARAMTLRDGDRVNQWGMALGSLGVWWGIQTLSWAQNDAFFDQNLEPTTFQFNNPANIESLRFVQNLVHAEAVAPSPTVADQQQDTTNFQSGRVAFVAEGSWQISSYAELPFEWGVAPIPSFAGNRVVPYWLGGWVIAKASEVPDAAFEWARWSATDYQTTMADEHDWIPILNSARESESMVSGMPAGFPAAAQSLSSARLGDFYTTNIQQIWLEAFDPNLQKLFANDATPEETAAAIDEAANALL